MNSTRLLALTLALFSFAAGVPRSAVADDDAIDSWVAPDKRSREFRLLRGMSQKTDRGGRLAVGAVWTGVGLASIVTATELGIQVSSDPYASGADVPFLGALGAMSLGVGVPTMIFAAVEGGAYEDAPPVLRAALVRAKAARTLSPVFATVGALGGLIGTTLGVELAGAGEPTPGAFIMGGLGFSMLSLGGVIARIGDDAMSLGGPHAPLGFARVAIPMITAGAVGLGMTPLVRTIGSYDASEPQALIALGSASGVLIAVGVAIAVDGGGRQERWQRGVATARRARPGAPQLLGAAPVVDLQRESVGFGVLGVF